MRRDFVKILLFTALAAMVPERAYAQSTAKLPRLGMDPGEPLTKSAPPSTPFGRSPATSKDAVLDFHGFIQMPMRFALLKRPEAICEGTQTVSVDDCRAPGQSETALHSPPLIPQEETRFEFTGVVPTPWIQLNFSYGNKTVYGTAVIAAREATDASGIFDATKQLGVSSAYLNVNLSETFKTPFEIKVGALTSRYGAMGQYDAGRYGTPLIAKTSTVGVTTTVGLDLGKGFQVVLEQGIGTSVGRPGSGLLAEGWNDFGYTGAQGTPSEGGPAGVGSTLVNHLHAVVGYNDVAQLGLHYLQAWTQDEQVTPLDTPDGSMGVLAADLQLSMGAAGRLFIGAAKTDAENAAVVSGSLQVLNTRGGPEFILEYLGPESNGNGGLMTYGAQYDLSLARALYGDFFRGNSADVRLSLFGIATTVESDDANYDDVSKLKFGFEATYSMLSWFGASARFDHVEGDTSDSTKSMNIISPRLLFHTDWLSRDEISLQYSYFQYGKNVLVRTGYPPVADPGAEPDKHVFVISGTMWW